MNVQLQLGPLSLAPTFVYETETDVVPDDSNAAPLETSVRYFFRPIVYTDQEDEVRGWPVWLSGCLVLWLSACLACRSPVCISLALQAQRYWNSGEVILYRQRATAVARMPGTPSRAADTTAAHGIKSPDSGRGHPSSTASPAHFESAAASASAQQTPVPTPPMSPAVPPRTPAGTKTPSKQMFVPLGTSSAQSTPKATPKLQSVTHGTDSPV